MQPRLLVTATCDILKYDIIPQLYNGTPYVNVRSFVLIKGHSDPAKYTFIENVVVDLQRNHVPRNPGPEVFEPGDLKRLQGYCTRFAYRNKPVFTYLSRLVQRWTNAIETRTLQDENRKKIHAAFTKYAPEVYKCLREDCRTQIPTCANNRSFIASAKQYLQPLNEILGRTHELRIGQQQVYNTLVLYIRGANQALAANTDARIVVEMIVRQHLLYQVARRYPGGTALHSALTPTSGVKIQLGAESSAVLFSEVIPTLDEVFVEDFELPTLDVTNAYMALRNELMAIVDNREEEPTAPL